VHLAACRGRAGAHQSCVTGLIRRNIVKLCCQFLWPRCGPSGAVKRSDNPAVAGDANLCLGAFEPVVS